MASGTWIGLDFHNKSCIYQKFLNKTFMIIIIIIIISKPYDCLVQLNLYIYIYIF